MGKVLHQVQTLDCYGLKSKEKKLERDFSDRILV